MSEIKGYEVFRQDNLHYVFDLWAEVWRKKIAKGDIIIVRYADDLVLGFQYRAEAERFLREFRERLAKFGLELHADKTRLIEFGRFAAREISPRPQQLVPRHHRCLQIWWRSPSEAIRNA